MKTRTALFTLFLLLGAQFASALIIFDPGKITASVARSQAAAGIVSAVVGNRIFLFDGRLIIDASHADVRNELGAVTVADIHPGDRITAGIMGATGGALTAYAVQVENVPDADISGRLDSFNADTLVVFGTAIHLQDGATLRYQHGHDLPGKEGLKPGQFVSVRLDRNQPGLVAAAVVVLTGMVPPMPGFAGVVDRIDGDLWAIRSANGTVQFRATGDSQFIGLPAKGDEVNVTYMQPATDSLPTILFIAKVEKSDSDIPVRGTLVSLSETSVTVRADVTNDLKTATVTQNTLFLGKLPVAGDPVTVFVRERADGSVIATAIARSDEVDTGNYVEIKGTLQATDGKNWRVDATSFVVSDRTKLIGNPKLGDEVKVTAMQANDLMLYALEVRVDREPAEIENH
jgi:hypothetical protein